MPKIKLKQIDKGTELANDVSTIKNTIEDTEYLARLASPSDIYENIPFVTDNNTCDYTAPADGVIEIIGKSKAYLQECTIAAFKDGVLRHVSSSIYVANAYNSLKFNILKGELYTIIANNTNIETAKFYYNVGSALKLGLMS